ncbi:MAG: hypothetical protein IPJ61_11220 [Tessaracoccus sp.]|uniref:hypothetical protein n=1 Tax=Tessaracoccus sp. TaxID=1971211 RepID=UPI001EBA4232|nr:hypothetical protein [Tessaracoccus sp.]MBK7821615.1 hypothetical protein [Tessaracoccus sp.]
MALVLSGVSLVASADPELPDDPVAEAMADAVSSGSSVEIPELTDEHSLSVANPDGTVTLTLDRAAVRVRDGEEFGPVDTTVVEAGNRLEPAASVLEMDFSAGGDTALATVRDGDHAVTMHVPFVLPAPSVDGDQVTYPEVLPGVDLVVSVSAESFSEVLVVKNRQAASNPELESLAFRIEGDGLDYVVAGDGSAEAVDAEGEAVFTSPSPVMWDSAPTSEEDIPDATSPAEVVAPIEVTESALPSDEGLEVVLSPDQDALTGADVVYPVFIDPSLGKDRNNFLVVRSTGSSYYNTNDVFRVGYCNWTGCSPAYKARSFFDFDVSQLKPKSDGSKATIAAAAVTVKRLF